MFPSLVPFFPSFQTSMFPSFCPFFLQSCFSLSFLLSINIPMFSCFNKKFPSVLPIFSLVLRFLQPSSNPCFFLCPFSSFLSPFPPHHPHCVPSRASRVDFIESARWKDGPLRACRRVHLSFHGQIVVKATKSVLQRTTQPAVVLQPIREEWHDDITIPKWGSTNIYANTVYTQAPH